ncbi:hypothetical protein [Frankia sp. AvcI1]|uniref:hypothetical protein n=1 Tax=Frankia sp. AvcI1 TaxID=573496 RepID=UPI0021181A12|nr:hypothetical protein [Frankia sp. AvcI1]
MDCPITPYAAGDGVDLEVRDAQGQRTVHLPVEQAEQLAQDILHSVALARALDGGAPVHLHLITT